ncbi:YchJ family protein [Gordonia sp. DT30]|uniref:YchJ family protein n=1 Tax=Gordonia sp. DT30 TaxID=3416546 RepID=UPI003CE6997B
MRDVRSEDRCPCTSGMTFGECCGPILSRDRRAPTAPALMRSRFTAFAVGDRDHLLATWHPGTQPAILELDDEIDWYRLVTDTVAGGPFDDVGEVTFVAHYRAAAARRSMSEHSRFRRERGNWYYVDGDVA